MRGNKGEKHSDPAAPPRHRANKQKGHGSYANDRPPIVGMVGRESGQVRLRMVKHTNAKTVERHIARFTQPAALANTAEWQGYNQIENPHVTVNQGIHEWARDDAGDGIREVHSNTTEGLWTGVRNFLRPVRGVHTDYLPGSVAMAEHHINHKCIAPEFIAALVRCT